jgi:hypothetical protein
MRKFRHSFGQDLSNQTESRSLGQLLRKMKSPLSNGDAGDESQCSDRDGLFVGAYIVNQREPPSGQIFCWTVIGSAARSEHARSHGTLLGCRWNSKNHRQGISLIGPKKKIRQNGLAQWSFYAKDSTTNERAVSPYAIVGSLCDTDVKNSRWQAVLEAEIERAPPHLREERFLCCFRIASVFEESRRRWTAKSGSSTGRQGPGLSKIFLSNHKH